MWDFLCFHTFDAGRRERLSQLEWASCTRKFSVGQCSRQLRRNGPATPPSQASRCFPGSPVRWTLSWDCLSNAWTWVNIDSNICGLNPQSPPQASPEAPGKATYLCSTQQVQGSPHSWTSLSLSFHKRQPWSLG